MVNKANTKKASYIHNPAKYFHFFTHNNYLTTYS